MKTWDDLTAKERRDPMRMKLHASSRPEPVRREKPAPVKPITRLLGGSFFRGLKRQLKAMGGLGMPPPRTIRSLISTPALKVRGPARRAELAGGASPENQESGL